MIRPLILAALRPYRIAALRWLDQNAIDLLCAVQALLTPEVEIRVREVCAPAGPSVATAVPREAAGNDRWQAGSLGGVVFRRPMCPDCCGFVDLTLTGDDEHTADVVFTCHKCQQAEVVTFDPPVADADAGEWLAVAKPFGEDEPS